MDDLKYFYHLKEEISSKTIFILDRSKKCLETSSEQFLDMDLKMRTLNNLVLCKTLYTCSVDAVFEYSRIVWDLFPNNEKSLLFISTSPNFTCTLNDWNKTTQNTEAFFNFFIKLAKDSDSNYLNNFQRSDDNYSKSFLIDGFKTALMRLSASNKCKKSSTNNDVSGRIIIITFENEKNFVDLFKEELLEELEYHNKKTETKISNLDVILINNHPVNLKNPLIQTNLKQKLSKQLQFSVYSSESGSILATKLIGLAFEHYDLASTTVCGIPMKEEQNSNSSGHYDVEIIHSIKAHSEIYSIAENPESLFHEIDREQLKYKTLKLRWILPSKTNTTEMNNSIGVYRIAALDVTSRPTCCLINFLHSGKLVGLEMPKKILSHQLKCHNGELFIHVLTINRPAFTDLIPSISEGVGGTVFDYRLNEFADLMKRNHLKIMNNPDDRKNLMRQNDFLLQKQTLYWPLSLGFTVFFNIRDHFQQFYQTIIKEKLTEQDLIDLKNVIYQCVKWEQSSTLPIPMNQIRIKNLKKTDLFEILKNEMRYLLRCYNQTPQHKKILQCHIELNPKNELNNLPLALPLTNGDNNTNNDNNDNKTDFEMKTQINFKQIKASKRNLKEIYISQFMTKQKKPDFTEKILNNYKKIQCVEDEDSTN